MCVFKDHHSDIIFFAEDDYSREDHRGGAAAETETRNTESGSKDCNYVGTEVYIMLKAQLHHHVLQGLAICMK